jgi:hypothetical protein
MQNRSQKYTAATGLSELRLELRRLKKEKSQLNKELIKRLYDHSERLNLFKQFSAAYEEKVAWLEVVKINSKPNDKKEQLEIAELKKEIAAMKEELDNERRAIDQEGEGEAIIALTRKVRAKDQILTNEIKKLTLLERLITEERPCFERIVVGGGVAGTLVCAEMSTEFREEGENDFPAILVLNDEMNPNTWPKEDDRFMGQPAGIQTPQNLYVHSTDFGTNPHRPNPYNYTVAEDFSRSIIETQNQMNLPLVNLKALKIESKDKMTPQQLQADWEIAEAKHRIAVRLNGKTIYLYTKALDLCIGLGDPNLLDPKQVSPALAKELMETNKLIYAQDGNAELRGDVVFLGSSAINAAWVAEIQEAGSQSKARVVAWVAPDGKTCENPKKLNRLIASLYENGRAQIHLGKLKKVEKLSNGKLKLSFDAPANRIPAYPNLAGRTLICDQLVASFGQRPHELTKGLQGFVSCTYRNKHKQVDNISLGTCSADGSIVCWGAAGSLGIGLPAQQVRAHTESFKERANTYPQETRAPGGIFGSSFAIPKLAAELRKQDLFPEADPFAQEDMMPDINKATLGDLMDFLQEADEFGRFADEHEKIASHIISLRGVNKKTDDHDLPGIHSVAQLRKVVPMELLDKFAWRYFPFEKPQNVLLSRPISFFGLGSQPVNDDSYVRLSDASSSAANANANTREIHVSALPAIKVGGKSSGNNR